MLAHDDAHAKALIVITIGRTEGPILLLHSEMAEMELLPDEVAVGEDRIELGEVVVSERLNQGDLYVIAIQKTIG